MSVGLKSHENWFDISPTKSLLIGLISPPSYVCWFIGWFIIPLTIVINSNFTMYRLYNPINCRYITHKNHSYWSYLHQLNAIERGHRCAPCRTRRPSFSPPMMCHMWSCQDHSWGGHGIKVTNLIWYFPRFPWHMFPIIGETWYKRFPQMLHGPWCWNMSLHLDHPWGVKQNMVKIWRASRETIWLHIFCGWKDRKLSKDTYIFGIIRSCLSGECGQFNDEVFPFGTSPSKQKMAAETTLLFPAVMLPVTR